LAAAAPTTRGRGLEAGVVLPHVEAFRSACRGAACRARSPVALPLLRFLASSCAFRIVVKNASPSHMRSCGCSSGLLS
jgi:hypothetical protein